MSPGVKQYLRILLGLVGGFVGGMVVGICLMLLLLAVCTAAGGGWASETKPAWLGGVIFFAQYAIAIVFPLAGPVVGVLWAIRRNRRDETKPP